MTIYALWHGGPSYRMSSRHESGDVEMFDSVADAVDEMSDRIHNRDGRTPCVEDSRLEIFHEDPSGNGDYEADMTYVQVGDVVLSLELAEMVDEVTRHYAVAALWSSIGDDDEPLDENYDVDDIAPDTLQGMRDDVVSFLAENAEDIANLTYPGHRGAEWSTASLIGHDFWLTRNGHGAGFWDRGLGELGDRLTESARVYGSVDLYVIDGEVQA